MPHFLPSLLDRFCLPDASLLRSRSIDQSQGLQHVKKGIARDLQTLLNTRRETRRGASEEFPHVHRSLVMYGLPDFTTLDPENRRDRQQLRRILEQTIVTFEPRLTRVRVVEEERRPPLQKYDQILRFRIEAELRLDQLEEASSEAVRFTLLFQLPLKKYVVQGDRLC